jgi:hypothetical protein
MGLIHSAFKIFLIMASLILCLATKRAHLSNKSGSRLCIKLDFLIVILLFRLKVLVIALFIIFTSFPFLLTLTSLSRIAALPKLFPAVRRDPNC